MAAQTPNSPIFQRHVIEQSETPISQGVHESSGSSDAKTDAISLSLVEESTPKSWWHFCRWFSEKPIDTTWQSTFWRWSPHLGVGSLIFVLLNIPASAIVLATSNGPMIENWSISPNVWLASFVGVGNKALAFAALQGSGIAWWLRAIDGTTMERLHRDWSHGPGAEIWAILTSGRRIELLAMATLCSTVILVDGILLQRATTVVQSIANEPI